MGRARTGNKADGKKGRARTGKIGDERQIRKGKWKDTARGGIGKVAKGKE